MHELPMMKLNSFSTYRQRNSEISVEHKTKLKMLSDAKESLILPAHFIVDK